MTPHFNRVPTAAEVARQTREKEAELLALEAIDEARRSAREACTPSPELPWLAATRAAEVWLGNHNTFGGH